MKFFSVTFVVTLFCAVAVSAAPSSSQFYSELSLIDESTFGVTDIVTNAFNSMIEKTKCTLDVIESLISDDSLLKVFQKFRSDIKTTIKVNVTECVHTKGLTPKLKCTFAITKKFNTLYFAFIKDVSKANINLATKITKALVQCAKKPAPFVSNDDAFISFDNEISPFGFTDIVEKIYDALIKKTKCALDAIEDIVGEGELRHVYKKLRTDVEAILMKDVKECAHTNGLIGKTKCFLTLQQKVNTLFAKFINEVMKTNKSVAKNIYKALAQCLKTPKPEEPTTTTEQPKTTTEQPEEPKTPTEEVFISSFDSEISTFGLNNIDEKIYDALIEKTICALEAIEDIVGEGELRHVYKKLQSDVQAILMKEIKECAHTNGLIGKAKCFLTLQQKVNILFAKFVNEVRKTNKNVAKNIYKALAQCLKTPKPEEPKTTTPKPTTTTEQPEVPKTPTEEVFISSFDNEISTFGLTDIVEKIYDALIEKTICALDAIEDIVGEGELRHVYQKLRTDVEAILMKDVKECAHTNGVIGKTKCFLTLQQKVNSLFAKFINEVMKTNKNVAKNIYKALAQCLKTPKPEEPKTTTPKPTTTTEQPEEPKTPTEEVFISSFDNEISPFGLTDAVTNVLNSLIEKIKCTLDAIENLVGEGELREVYKEFRTNVEFFIVNEFMECVQTQGLLGKMKCTLKFTQIFNELFADFLKEVLKANKDVAANITKAIVQCAKKTY